MLRGFMLTCLGFTLTQCVSLRSISVTQIPKERSKIVTAEVKKFVFLAFNFDNDYVDAVTEELRSQCQGGTVTGILTKHSRTEYFIAHHEIVSAQGYCVR